MAQDPHDKADAARNLTESTFVGGLIGFAVAAVAFFAARVLRRRRA